MSDAAPDRLLYHVEIDAPAEDVWAAITDPAQTPAFFFGTAVHSTWQVGAAITYDLGDEPAIAGTIVEYDPPRRFVMTARFRFGGIPFEEGESLVTWEVTPRTPNGALLTLTHDRVPPKTYLSVSGGWPRILGALHGTLVPGGSPKVVTG